MINILNMCGIFTLANYSETMFHGYNNIYQEFMKGSKRGPEFSILKKINTKLYFGFHRLAINGLNTNSNQPIHIDGGEQGEIILICNGEIYNYKELYKLMNVSPKTDSDCEVIGHLYLRYGIQQTLTMLDGVFSFVLLDTRKLENDALKLYVARDPYGVRPLYFIKNKNKFENVLDYPILAFASELKCLSAFYNSNTQHYSVGQFTPGTYSLYTLEDNNALWKPQQENIPYFIPTFSYSQYIHEKLFFHQIAYFLQSAVNKRCLCTERPIACLLSGGLDSSMIAALVNKFYRDNGVEKKLETYSIGLAGSEDLKYAKIVADYLDTNHTEIIITEEEMFDSIPEVIHAIESYDTTTVRASIGNYLLGKYISQNSNAKVIFNGDGSDELFGGYLYMNKCPDTIEFDLETRRLLKDIHLFDVLRSDKSISSHGLEPRTPFLDKSFVNYILSLPPLFRQHHYHNKMEKYILRNSFTLENFTNMVNGINQQLLPDEILWRRKEAFSDGVTNKGRSLYTIIQEKISENIKSPDGSRYPIHIETEKFYYKNIFSENYPNCLHIVPYYWMPKYTNATDPSARTLDLYTA
jgi:asparagine synthase (glutamine-hydrolysing)